MSISACALALPLSTNVVILQAVQDDFQTTFEGLSRHSLRVFGKRTDILGGGPWTTNDGLYTLSRGALSADPYFADMGLYTSSVKNARGGYAYCDLEYRGLDPSYGGTPPGPIYSLDRSTGSDPIQTHPKWSTAAGSGAYPGPIAGTPSSPVNGARFLSSYVNANSAIVNCFNPNGSGVPDPGFDPNQATFYDWLYSNANGSRSIFLGIEDYVSPGGQIWTATYVSFSAPSADDLAGVGYVSATPLGSPPTPDGFMWLYLGCKYTDQAGVFRIDKSWRMIPNTPEYEIIYNPY